MLDKSDEDGEKEKAKQSGGMSEKAFELFKTFNLPLFELIKKNISAHISNFSNVTFSNQARKRGNRLNGEKQNLIRSIC